MIPTALARFLLDTSPYNEFWSSWFLGFCIIGVDGQIHLTNAGAAFLEEIDA